MDTFFPMSDPFLQIAALGIAFCAGFVKGVVGFALPLVLISGLTLFLSPELALAGLILPTLFTNAQQSLRFGVSAAWGSIRDFRYFMVAGAVTLTIAAQTVRSVPEAVLFLVIGTLAAGYSALQLAGFGFHLRRRTATTDAAVGAITGTVGGMSGVWAPPTVMYLTALNTPKDDQVRVQGVIYGLGAVVLVGAHLGSGVLRAETLPFSALLILPALAGMWAGGKVAGRIDQVMFKRATLIVLLIAGANLIRRAVF